MKTLDHAVVSGVHVLTPRHNLAGGEETKELADTVRRLAESGAAPHIVLDLGEISWASSLGLESLLRAKRACTEAHGWLRLARLEKRVRNTVLVARFETLFDMFDTVEAAVTADTEAHA